MTFIHYQESGSAQALTSGTEAVVSPGGITPANLTYPIGMEGVLIRGRVNVTAGATSGNYSIKCRRAVGAAPTVASTQIGSTITDVAPVSAPFEIPFSFLDTAPVPQAQYALTLTAAGSNGTVNDVGLELSVPTPYGTEE